MEIPQDDFVSVSINATQLNIFIEDMFKLLKVQDKRMNELSEQFNNVTGSLAMRLRKQEEIFEDERQRQTQLEAQNHNYLNLSLLDAEKRTEQRLQIIEDNILTLENKMNLYNEKNEMDLIDKTSYLATRVSTLEELKDRETLLESYLEEFKKKFNELERTTQLDLEEIRDNMDELMKMTALTPEKEIESDSEEEMFKQSEKIVINKIEPVGEEIGNKELQECTNYPKPGRYNLRVSNASRISISKLGGFDKLLEATRSSGFRPEDKDQQEREKKLKIRIKTLESSKSNLTRRIVILEQCFEKITNKYEITEEQIEIILRKIEKEKMKGNELEARLKGIEEKKIDEKVIEGIRGHIKKLNKDLGEGLEGKLEKEYYESECAKINAKIINLGNSVNDKTNVGDFKKAYTFLESKIKELIIVLAEDHRLNNDGAAKKIPYKCLSCDKELEVINYDDTKCMPTKEPLITRCTTTRLRKRININQSPLLTEQS